MNETREVGELLRWQAARAARQAPPPPRAAALLEQIRPWWERWPERFRQLADSLAALDVRYGHAATDPRPNRDGFLVPTVVVRTQAEDRTHSSILYFAISGGRLRLRFQVMPAPDVLPTKAEVTFVDAATARALLVAPVEAASSGEYRVEAELPEKVAAAWCDLKVTDRMPFHLIVQQVEA